MDECREGFISALHFGFCSVWYQLVLPSVIHTASISPPFIPVLFQVTIGLGHVRTLWAHEQLSIVRNLVGSLPQIVLTLVVV